MNILDNEFAISVDGCHNTYITDKKKGFLKVQSVEAILLTEIIRLLKKQGQNETTR